MTEPSHSRVRIGDWLIDPELNQLAGPEQTVHLEPRTTNLLMELVAHAGRVRTRDELLTAVWGGAFVGEAVLTHCIWELRKAFGDDAKNPLFIQTVPRRGYRLVAPVSEPATVVVQALVAWSVLEGEDHGETMDLLRSCEGVPVAALDEVGVAVETPGVIASGLELGRFERPAHALRFALALQASGPERLARLGVSETGESATRRSTAVGSISGNSRFVTRRLKRQGIGRLLMGSQCNWCSPFSRWRWIVKSW